MVWIRRREYAGTAQQRSGICSTTRLDKMARGAFRANKRIVFAETICSPIIGFSVVDKRY
jgi:hypothetical protein